MIEIYTDGACSGNPGPGGYGVLVINREIRMALSLSGYRADTTNNQMELMAVVKSLEYSNNLPSTEIEIYMDSKYVYSGITNWMRSWIRNRWRKADGKPVLNVEIWKRINDLISSTTHSIKWNWVKGHSNNKYNEMVDRVATTAISERKGSLKVIPYDSL